MDDLPTPRSAPGHGADVLEFRLEGVLDENALSKIADEIARLLASRGDVVLDVSGATLVGVARGGDLAPAGR